MNISLKSLSSETFKVLDEKLVEIVLEVQNESFVASLLQLPYKMNLISFTERCVKLANNLEEAIYCAASAGSLYVVYFYKE